MIKKAFACTDLRGELNVCPKRVCDDKIFSNRKPDFCHPVTILPTPYFNALRGVARANKMLCKKLDQIFSNKMYEAIFTLAFSHGLSYKGQPECSKELKQAKEAITKLEKEENENGK